MKIKKILFIYIPFLLLYKFICNLKGFFQSVSGQQQQKSKSFGLTVPKKKKSQKPVMLPRMC